jgi:glycine dehydrogenase
MLKVVGAKSLDDLIDKVVPKAIRQEAPLDLPEPLSERNTLSDLRRMAGRNHVYTSMIGMGYYGCVTPKVILRNVLENPGWYTAYTPYQAEVSQGRLEALLIFQQMVTDLTGLPLANSSLLDEATAAAEAMAMAKRVTKSKANAFFVDRDTHPQTLSVIETRARAFGFEVIVGDPDSDIEADKLFGALLSYPGSSGEVRDHRGAIEKLHGAGALAIVATDLLALALLESPGKLGADVAWARPSASACRWAMAARTRRSSPPGRSIAAPFRGASSGCRSTARAIGRCAWRCRPANSTSGARRPPATSAPRRSCWR